MKKAFTLIEILIVVSIIALLAAVGIPSLLGSQTAANEKMKEVNISTVNAAKDQWSILYNKPVGYPRQLERHRRLCGKRNRQSGGS